MSTEERLTRLGLLHLMDKPEELAAELAKRAAAYQVEVDAWNKAREAQMDSVPAPPSEEASATHSREQVKRPKST